MHHTPAFPEHKSPGLPHPTPKIPIEWTRRLSPGLSGKVVLAGSNNHISSPTPALSSQLHPEWHRMSRDPGPGGQGTAEQRKASSGQGLGEPSEPPSRGAGSASLRREGGREGDPGRGRAGGGSARKRGGKAALAAQVTVPTAAARSPRRRASSARVEGSFGETESKSPGGGGGVAGRPGGAVPAAGRAGGSRGRALRSPPPREKLAREARAGSPRRPRAASRLLRGLGDPCRSRNRALERSLQNWRAAGYAKLPARKVAPGYSLQICHVL